MNAVQCDYCGKFAANPDGRSYSGRQRLPEGWWFACAEQLDTPAESRSPSAGVGGDFCSLDCASKFLAKPRDDE